MRDDLILTFDLGTSRLKISAFDFQGELKGQVTSRNREYSQGEAAWQSAEDWWANVCDGTRTLIKDSAILPEQFRGVSLSGRAGAGVFVDDAGRVIADPWSDNRHSERLREITAELPPTSAQYGPTLLAKLLWLRAHRPDDAARVRYALYGKDFLLLRLTGVAATDPSSGPDGAWDETLCRQLEIDPEVLPQVMMPWSIAGTLSAEAATSLDLQEGTPVAVGAHDGICANAGAAAITPGRFALTLGTHAVMRGITTDYPEGARRFYGFPPDRHVIGGNALFAGRALDWFIDQHFGTAEHDRERTFAQLDRDAASVAVGANGIRFLPFLRGRIAPSRQPHVRAAWTGLGLESSHAAQYRAVLEGTAFALREVFDQLTGWIGQPSYVGVTGSGARSATWTGILASVLGVPLTLTDGASEGRGAAIFCAAALGSYPTVRDATANMVTPSRVVDPDADLARQYEPVMDEWQSIAKTVASLDASN